MSLNFDNNGLPVALEGKEIIFLSDNDDDDGYEKIESDINLIPIPKISKNDRDVILIVGKSGSGKSSFCAMYIKQYLKMFDNMVYIFSKHKNDPAFNFNSDRVRQINMKEYSERQMEIDLNSFKNSLVVFDDTDQIYDDDEKEAVLRLRNDILENGRKLFIYCLITKHMFPNTKADKIVNVETRAIVFFPKHSNRAEIDNYLHKQLLLKKKMRNTILSVDARWVLFSNEIPLYVLSPNEIFLIK